MNKLSKFDLAIFILSIYTVLELYLSTILVYTDRLGGALFKIDFVICLIFLFDFFNRLYNSENKLDYVKWNFIDFISSIPMIGVLRVGRVFRIIRILRLFRSGKVFVNLINKFNSKKTFINVFFFILILIFIFSFGIFSLEQQNNHQFENISDSIWWSFITTFTLSLSQDISPITTEGKFFTAMLIVMGFILISLFTAMLTDYFIDDDGINEKLDSINQELSEIKEEILKIKK